MSAVTARRLLVTSASTSVASVSALVTAKTAAAAAATTTATVPATGAAGRTNRGRAALEVSEAAARRIRELVARRRKASANGDPPPLGVRVGVRTRGCNGMSYTMDYAINPGKFDERVDIPALAAGAADTPAMGTATGTPMASGNRSDARKTTFTAGTDPPQLAVYIDPRALMHIIGTRMDYVDTDLASEFVFENPNAKGTCGCGESFNV